MARPKSKLRVEIERFLGDTSEYRDDWLSIDYKGPKEKRRIYSLVYMLKQNGYPIGNIDIDVAARRSACG